jgi:hypothetical protein
LVAVHGARDNANGIAPLLLLSTDGTTGIFTDAMSASGSRVGVLPLGLDALVGELLVANVIDATSPCDELVYATTSTVAVLEPCDAQGHLVQSASPSTVLTVSSVLTTLAVVDINADGHMDLLFALSSTPYVAFGGGDGHFYEDPSATGALGFLTLALDSRAPGASTGPIGESMQPVFAAGVVDSSGRVALLTESQVLLSSGGRRVTGTYQLQANALVRRLSGTWTSARIDDINRDGHADLLLGSSFADVDLLLGTGSGVFTRMKVSTHAPVSHIATADIDGDGVRDTIVVEDDIDGTGSTLRVAYGNPLTGPQALTTVAQVKSIKQVVGIALDSQSPAEAVAIVSGGTAGSDQLTVLTSEGARTPISPVSLVTSPSTVEGQALVLAVGRFLDRQRQDAVVVAIDSNAQGTMGPPQARLWTVTSLSTRGHEVFASEALAGISVVTPGGGVTVSLLAADANGDGLDELYMLTVDTSGRTTLLAASSSNGGGVGPTEILLLPTFIAAGADSSLLALDVDRDGLRDLVVLCRGADGSSELLVLWNDGGFSTSMVSEVATDSPLLAMGTLVLDGAWGAEVVVSTEKALHVLRSGGTPRQLVLAAVEGSGGGTALATADINGDGLLDVAIGAASGITVYFGEATQP